MTSHTARDDRPTDELRRVTRARLEGMRRLKFHVAAWVLGMIG